MSRRPYLTDDDWCHIIYLRRCGAYLKQIAYETGFSESAISKVLKRAKVEKVHKVYPSRLVQPPGRK